MPSNIRSCHPLLLLPSIFPSIRVFSNESALLIRWPKYWSFSFSISPSNEYLGLISFRMDWLDLLAVQLRLVQFFFSKLSPRASGPLTHSGFMTVGCWDELNSCKWRPSRPPALPPCSRGKRGQQVMSLYSQHRPHLLHFSLEFRLCHISALITGF